MRQGIIWQRVDSNNWTIYVTVNNVDLRADSYGVEGSEWIEINEDTLDYDLEVVNCSGETLELSEDEKEYYSSMKVLAQDGSIQMELVGGERIFSRKNTVTLIKLAKIAYSSNNDKDYKKLGKRLFKYLHKQDTNTPEYVNAPKEK